jgi:predicted DNA-binding protein
MARIGLIITDEMEANLNAESVKTHIASSELVRMAIEAFLKERGHEFKEVVVRGGARKGTGPKPSSKKRTAGDE